ncbi:MAG: hypothetical protein EZS28_048683, partial [Streblomastix strix]
MLVNVKCSESSNFSSVLDEQQQYLKYIQRIREIKNNTIARLKENRTEMAGRGILVELIEMLQWARKLEIKEYARNIQQDVCEVVIIIMSDNSDAIDLALQSDLVQELMKLLKDDLPFEEVDVIHISALKSFCTFGSPEQRHILYDLGLYKIMVPFLKSTNNTVAQFTSTALYKLFSWVWYLHGGKSLNPQFEALDHDGIIQILFEDGLRKGKNEKTKVFCADCLGLIFRARELPFDMKSEIIAELKKGLVSLDKSDIKCSSR